MKVHLPPISPKKTFTSPGRTEQLFSPKLNNTANVLTSLDKSIRTNNITQFLGDTRTIVNLNSNEDDIMAEEKREIINSLITVRKKLDEVKELSEKKINDSNRLKHDLEKITADEEVNGGNMKDASFKSEQLKATLKLQKLKIEEVTHAQTSYKYMLDRLKKDKTADQMKVYHLEEEYNKRYHELSARLLQNSKEEEFQTQIKHFAEDVKNQVVQEKELREKNLTTLIQSLSAREEYDIKKEKRSEHIQQVADSAAAEVGDEQKRWNELFLTHKFVGFFLKGKIDRQVSKYEAVEKAFQRIKASTGLTDLNEIISKFLNREERYSELLISIADFERKVDIARKNKDKLESKLAELKDQSLTLDKLREEKRGDKGQLNEAQKELNHTITDYKKANLTLVSAHKWSVRTLIKLDKAQNVAKESYNDEYPQEKMPEVFFKIIEGIRNNLEVLKEKAADGAMDDVEKFNVDEVIMNKDIISKNTRVRPANQAAQAFEDAAKNDTSRGQTEPDDLADKEEVYQAAGSTRRAN